MLTCAQFISAITEIISIWVLFDRFKVVKGWTLPELALLYGIIHTGFSVAESLGRGFDKFSFLLKQGGFDRFLVRPVGTLFQVATSEVCPMKMGRFLQGLLILIWGASKLNISFFSLPVCCLFFAFVGTVCLFYGLFVIQASLAFWLTDTLELLHVLTYGGRETGQYPITIFNRPFTLLFTYIVPLACVIYYPIASILHRENIPLLLGCLAPLAGILFLLASFQLWKKGSAHYSSTGS